MNPFIVRMAPVSPVAVRLYAVMELFLTLDTNSSSFAVSTARPTGPLNAVNTPASVRTGPVSPLAVRLYTVMELALKFATNSSCWPHAVRGHSPSPRSPDKPRARARSSTARQYDRGKLNGAQYKTELAELAGHGSADHLPARARFSRRLRSRT